MAKGTLQIKYEKLVMDNLDQKERIKELKLECGRQATKICVLNAQNEELEKRILKFEQEGK